MIVTFYSYKGGTGRTMALANIACLLAKFGRRVLIVDFDLEAPGVWRYFNEFHSGLEHRAGLIDLLLAQMNHSYSLGSDWRQYTTKVRIGAESIILMTSGTLNDDYPARILEFNWANFFQHHSGGQFFEQLRNDWKHEYDFVLIDSRTGITDIGGICTIALPDLIVPVFVANSQNLDGIVDTMRRAQRGRQELAYDRPPALILPVLSRFDSRTELRSANEWLSLAASRLGEFYSDWLPKALDPRVVLERTKLPYIAYFGFGEKLAVLLQGVTDPESLGYSLNSIAKLIDSNLRDAAAVMSDSDKSPSDAVSSRVPLEPSSDSWIAAIYASDSLIGTGVVIDQRRLLTSAHVVADFSAHELGVEFPKAADRSVRKHRFAVRDLSLADPGGLAVIHLISSSVPPSVQAAPVRFPRANDLVGSRWWAFGFPDRNELGESSDGTVGGTLALGAIRLDVKSSYRFRLGFAGAPVWSSEYSAVVGIVTLVDRLGNGAAITLAEAADDLPEENLRLLMDRSPRLELTAKQRDELAKILASVFTEGSDAADLLESAGVPRHRLRQFESYSNARLYWEQVLVDIENGLIEDGVPALVVAAIGLYPANAALRMFAGNLSDSQ